MHPNVVHSFWSDENKIAASSNQKVEIFTPGRGKPRWTGKRIMRRFVPAISAVLPNRQRGDR